MEATSRAGNETRNQRRAKIGKIEPNKHRRSVGVDNPSMQQEADAQGQRACSRGGRSFFSLFLSRWSSRMPLERETKEQATDTEKGEGGSHALGMLLLGKRRRHLRLARERRFFATGEHLCP